jgi:hypothetical protein
MNLPIMPLLIALVVPTATPELQPRAYLTGERVTGSTKQCFYEWAGREYTRTVRSIDLCPRSIEVRAPVPPPREDPDDPRTVVAYKTGEQVTGSTKQCYYEWAGNRYTRTVESYQLCPLSIRVRIGEMTGRR